NPDATLWTTSLLAFLAFFIYIKTYQRKYIFISGLFLGMALLSKFFASIFYLIFFVVIYLEYLKTFDKGQFFRRLWDLAILMGITVAIYFLFVPASWQSLTVIFKGTLATEILKPGMPLVW